MAVVYIDSNKCPPTTAAVRLILSNDPGRSPVLFISWDPGIDYQIRYHSPQVSYKCPGPLCPGTVDLCIDVLFPTVFCFPTKFCIECFDFLVKQDFLSLKKVEGEVIFNPLKKTLAWPGRSALY